MPCNILVIHGPNLNLLGKREPDIYGSFTLNEINQQLSRDAESLKINLKIYQSNQEGDIIDYLHQVGLGWADGILMNPGAYTHTSIAIRDALTSISKPVVEVHLSNIYSRESFRHKSLIAPIAIGQISGFGPESYYWGLKALVHWLKKQKTARINKK